MREPRPISARCVCVLNECVGGKVIKGPLGHLLEHTVGPKVPHSQTSVNLPTLRYATSHTTRFEHVSQMQQRLPLLKTGYRDLKYNFP